MKLRRAVVKWLFEYHHLDQCTFESRADLHTPKRRGGFRGGADAPPPSGIRPPADPKGTPFDTFSEIHFWRTDPKIFLKAPSAPIYTNFEGERAPKKRNFLPKFFKKCPKTAFLTVFSKICLRRRKFCQNKGKNSALGELEKSIWST